MYNSLEDHVMNDCFEEKCHDFYCAGTLDPLTYDKEDEIAEYICNECYAEYEVIYGYIKVKKGFDIVEEFI